jgi:hypothetical protein
VKVFVDDAVLREPAHAGEQQLAVRAAEAGAAHRVDQPHDVEFALTG